MLVNLFPSGDRLMEDFYYAGGLPALMKIIESVSSGTELTVAGSTVRAKPVEGARCMDPEVIRPLDRPVSACRRVGGVERQSGTQWRGHQAQRRQ